MLQVRFFVPKEDNEHNALVVETEMAVSLLTKAFGGSTIYSNGITGLWEQDGRLFADQHTVVEVVCDDTPEHKEMLREHKEIIRQATRQIELWVVCSQVEVL